jgi:hypothetical protein
MDALFSSLDYHDPVWIAVAFALGMAAHQVGLPPLVGFLLAGFALDWAGAEGGKFLDEIADLGVRRHRHQAWLAGQRLAGPDCRCPVLRLYPVGPAQQQGG